MKAFRLEIEKFYLERLTLEHLSQKYVDWIEGDNKATEYTLTQLSNDFQQAKQMEKEQMIDSWYNGFGNRYDLRKHNNADDAEQYYNETYGN